MASSENPVHLAHLDAREALARAGVRTTVDGEIVAIHRSNGIAARITLAVHAPLDADETNFCVLPMRVAFATKPALAVGQHVHCPTTVGLEGNALVFDAVAGRLDVRSDVGPWTRWKLSQRQKAALGPTDPLSGSERDRIAALHPRGRILVIGRKSIHGVADFRAALGKTFDELVDCEDVPLQGAGAVTGLQEALRRADPHRHGLVVIVRGGGDETDLQPFEDARVASAVRGCAVPVVVGIGHSRDKPLINGAAKVACDTPGALGKAVAGALWSQQTGHRSWKEKCDVLQRRVTELASAKTKLDVSLRDTTASLEAVDVELTTATGRRIGRHLTRQWVVLLIGAALAGLGLLNGTDLTVIRIALLTLLVASLTGAGLTWLLARQLAASKALRILPSERSSLMISDSIRSAATAKRDEMRRQQNKPPWRERANLYWLAHLPF